MQSEDYNQEPVSYCSRCYSLKIKYEESIDSECCADCGCLDITTSSIEDWEKLYERRYGHKFVNKSNDPKSSYIYTLSLSQLKTRVYKSPMCMGIIRSMYPRFPNGLSNLDSVLLFFDKLIKDNRLDDLKYYLWKNQDKNF